MKAWVFIKDIAPIRVEEEENVPYVEPLSAYAYFIDGGVWIMRNTRKDTLFQWISVDESDVPEKYRMQLLLLE